MKIRQAVFPVVFLGLLLFVAGCDNTTTTTPAESVQPQAVEQVEAGVGVEQVAIFYRTNDETGLQKEVNSWLSQNNGKVEIIRVLQSQSGRLNRYTIISIFYKKTR